MTLAMKWTLFLVLVTPACHAKTEAREVVAAVDAYRAASNDDKPARADALDKVACTDEQVCAVKAVCTKSADATAKGLRLSHEVQALASDGGNNSYDVGIKWQQARDDLEEGHGMLEDCRVKTEALRERYGL